MLILMTSVRDNSPNFKSLFNILTLSKNSLYTQRKPQVCSNPPLDAHLKYINY